MRTKSYQIEDIGKERAITKMNQMENIWTYFSVEKYNNMKKITREAQQQF